MKEIDVDVTYSTHDKEKQKLEDNIALAFKTWERYGLDSCRSGKDVVGVTCEQLSENIKNYGISWLG